MVTHRLHFRPNECSKGAYYRFCSLRLQPYFYVRLTGFTIDFCGCGFALYFMADCDFCQIFVRPCGFRTPYNRPPSNGNLWIPQIVHRKCIMPKFTRYCIASAVIIRKVHLNTDLKFVYLILLAADQKNLLPVLISLNLSKTAKYHLRYHFINSFLRFVSQLTFQFADRIMLQNIRNLN